MRQKKIHPFHVKSRLFGEVEKALRAGHQEIIFNLPNNGCKRRQLVAMHLLGDRILFFDPIYNPGMSYAAEIGIVGETVDGNLEGYRYEGRGLHSLNRAYVKRMFLEGRGWALIPVALHMAM